MNNSAQYWLNRVAVKLHRDFINGMDFERDEHRWIFDWDKDLSTEENLNNVVAEDKALATLTTVGAIKSGTKENYFRDQQLEALAMPGKEDIGMWGDRWTETDPAHREYDYIRFIDDLFYDKFIEFCEEHGINYKQDAVPATLEITNQVPIVHVGDKTYTLKTLQIGTPLVVIQAAYDHADERFSFDELRQWTKKTFEAQKRFTDIFKKNEFSKDNILNPFVDITPQTFMLKKQALLTSNQLLAIQKSSTK